MDRKLKYVRLSDNSIIIFSLTVEHRTFWDLKPVSAGFCYINTDETVDCFGESISLSIGMHEDDEYHVRRSVFGILERLQKKSSMTLFEKIVLENQLVILQQLLSNEMRGQERQRLEDAIFTTIQAINGLNSSQP